MESIKWIKLNRAKGDPLAVEVSNCPLAKYDLPSTPLPQLTSGFSHESDS